MKATASRSWLAGLLVREDTEAAAPWNIEAIREYLAAVAEQTRGEDDREVEVAVPMLA